MFIVRRSFGPLVGLLGVLGTISSFRFITATAGYLDVHWQDPAGYLMIGAAVFLSVVFVRAAIAGLLYTLGEILAACGNADAQRFLVLARRSAPLLVRSVLIAATGTSAVACTQPSPPADGESVTVVDPGWGTDPLPSDRARMQRQVGHRELRSHSKKDDRHIGQVIIVRRGDTLWTIAARTLPTGARTADIVNSWHRWYQVNRGVIGDDPNLIRPGQRLKRPAS